MPLSRRMRHPSAADRVLLAPVASLTISAATNGPTTVSASSSAASRCTRWPVPPPSALGSGLLTPPPAFSAAPELPPVLGKVVLLLIRADRAVDDLAGERRRVGPVPGL